MSNNSKKVLFLREEFPRVDDIKICKTVYQDEFISFVEKENIYGSQFHPEKSHLLGLKLIKCSEAVGYHWHPPFSLEQLPKMIEREIQRTL